MTTAIEELEKLAGEMDDIFPAEADTARFYAHRISLLANCLRTEVRDGKREAARAAWLEGGRRWSECSWNCDDAAKEADEYVDETYLDKEA